MEEIERKSLSNQLYEIPNDDTIPFLPYSKSTKEAKIGNDTDR